MARLLLVVRRATAVARDGWVRAGRRRQDGKLHQLLQEHVLVLRCGELRSPVLCQIQIVLSHRPDPNFNHDPATLKSHSLGPTRKASIVDPSSQHRQAFVS